VNRPTFLQELPRPLAFGTSGLRGLVRDMTDLEVYINTRGFLAHLKQADGLAAGETAAIAEDLRERDPASGVESSPRIARAVARAVRDEGLEPLYCGRIPTPALAYYAMLEEPRAGKRAMPCIMVTGSHIPADRNGVKFYRRHGEVLKADEAGILEAVAAVRAAEYANADNARVFDAHGMLRERFPLGHPDPRAEAAYHARYAGLFPGERPLAGRRLVLYEHSAVGRDGLRRLLEALGAEVVAEGRSQAFVPIDTEHVRAEDERRFAELAARHRPFGIVSTDGDGDRPFVVDEQGRFHRGDVLGILVAGYLGARFAAVPISTTDALDRWAAEREPPLAVRKTRIGSPYVIAAMNEAAARGAERVVGWEANGGFLTATDFEMGRGRLRALPTRDAVLPILAALLAAVEGGQPLSAAFAALPRRATFSDLLDSFAPEASRDLLAHFSPEGAACVEVEFENGSARVAREGEDERTWTELSAGEPLASALGARRERLARYFDATHGFGPITRIDYTDGVRVTFANGDIAHLRPSGNAPQLRVYAVAGDEARARAIAELAVAEPDGLLRRMARDLGVG